VSASSAPMQITDAHIHVQPFHMMPPAVAETFWKG
jgi:predicted urease superfamily metal-dependent hydrolase